MQILGALLCVCAPGQEERGEFPGGVPCVAVLWNVLLLALFSSWPSCKRLRLPIEPPLRKLWDPAVGRRHDVAWAYRMHAHAHLQRTADAGF